MTSQDTFFTENDYENFSFQPELAQLCVQTTFNTGHQSQAEQKPQDETAILEQVNKDAQSDTGLNIKYPRLSHISLEEQRDFIDKYEAELNGLCENMDKSQTSTWKEIKARVFSEQHEFQQFAYQHIRNNIEVFNAMPEDAKKIMEACQLIKTRRIKQNFEQYYNIEKTFGLSVGANFMNNTWLEFQEILLQKGDVPEIEKRTERFHVTFKNTAPTVTEQDFVTEDNLPIHKDLTAFGLAQQHNADIVTTSSSFTTLFNNEQDEQQWDIPVVVKNLEDTNEATDDNKKIIFFEKPMPRTAYTPHQIMRNVYKRALMKHLKKGEEKTTKSFVYSLWKFGKFTLLLRCKLDAFRTDDKTQTFLSIAAKPEYFPYFGYERLSASESAKWWIKSFIRPNVLLLCARIDTKTSAVLRMDELNPADVLSSGSVINTGQRLKVVYHIFCTMSEIPCNSYILSHQRNSPFCNLYRKANPGFTAKKPDMDIHARCSQPTSITKYSCSNVPWSGIDIEIFPTENIKQKLIPATFPAVTCSVLQHIRKSAESQWNPSISRGKKKKKKKKQKTKARQQTSGKSVNYRAVAPMSHQDNTMSRSERRKRFLRYRDFDAID